MASILRVGAAAAVALTALLPAAASSVGSTGTGLYGTVKKGPVKPVCRVDQPCDAPVQLTLVFTKTSPEGTVLQPTHKWVLRSSEQGKYKIALDPGYYSVRSTVKIGLTKLPRPHAVHVRAGHWDKIDLFFDTGIR
jgi:hypothetical protein